MLAVLQLLADGQKEVGSIAFRHVQVHVPGNPVAGCLTDFVAVKQAVQVLFDDVFQHDEVIFAIRQLDQPREDVRHADGRELVLAVFFASEADGNVQRVVADEWERPGLVVSHWRQDWVQFVVEVAADILFLVLAQLIHVQDADVLPPQQRQQRTGVG